MGKKENILYGSPGIVTLSDAMFKLYSDQLSRWPLARRNVRALKDVRTRPMRVGNVICEVQLNPARAISSKAKLDDRSISERKCFLCRENRPEEQMHIDFEGTKGKRYDILVNPYPVLQNHFIAASLQHTGQQIWQRYIDMLRLCKRAEGFTLMYNGPKSGASAPDHFHFQAIPSDMLPVEKYVRSQLGSGTGGAFKLLSGIRDASLYLMEGYVRGTFVIASDSSKSAAKLFYRLLDCAGVVEGEGEPRFNVFSFRCGRRYVSVVVMRKLHRSSHYFADEPSGHLSMGLGCIDMGGVIITVEKEDFDKLTPGLMSEVMDEITISRSEQDDMVRRLTRTQKSVCIELESAPRIEFEMLSYGAGRRTASLKDGRVEYGGQLYDEVVFDQRVSSTVFSEPSFVIHTPSGSVRYAGGLVIRAEDGTLRALNLIGVEDYLLSRFCAGGQPAAGLSGKELEDSIISLRKKALESPWPMKDGSYHGFPKRVSGEVSCAIDATWGRLG